MVKHYNVIIVGAGIAGLSVSRGLGTVDKVLLVDRKPIASDPNPPHETLAPYIEEMGYKDAILEKFTTMDIRTPTGTHTLKVFLPHCTLDYSKLCDLILAHGKAEFRLGNVEPIDSHRLKIDGEILESDFIVDCSGWRALIASTISKNNFGPIRMTHTIATTVKFKSTEDIISPTYFFDHYIIPHGGGFVIPFGDQALIGLGSYIGQEELRPSLNRLLKIVGVEPGIISEDFIPNHGLRSQTVGDVFVVGDAAGHSKPLRGKGLLRGTLYGLKCGDLIRQVIEGHKTTKQAKKEYHDYVMQEKPIYTMLGGIQTMLSMSSNFEQSLGTAMLANDNASFFWDKMY